MTITFSWWLVPIVLFFAPFIAIRLISSRSDYGSGPAIFGAFWFIGCWGAAIAFTLGYIVSR